nr:DIE2/ALG10 family [Tanacetum cinerariifolium]
MTSAICLELTQERLLPATPKDIEGIPLKLWTNNTFKKIASKWGSLINVEKSEEENFHSKRLCIHTNRMANVYETFKINHHGKVYWVCAKEILGWVPDFEEQSDDESDLDSEQSVEGFNGDIDGSEEEQQVKDDLSVVPDTLDTDKRRRKEKNESSNKESLQFPLGFTPREEGECDDSVHDNNASIEVNSANLRDNRTKKDGMESVGSGHIQKVEVPRTGGSILSLMDE